MATLRGWSLSNSWQGGVALLWQYLRFQVLGSVGIRADHLRLLGGSLGRVVGHEVLGVQAGTTTQRRHRTHVRRTIDPHTFL